MDNAYVAALETELEFANHAKPGGQAPDPGRIAVIEKELARARGGKKRRGETLETADAQTATETTDGPRAK